MSRYFLIFTVATLLHASTPATAHDVWLQTNSPIVRTGEVASVDLRLGNHGNGHRDFKLAGRITLDWVSVDHIAPDGQRTDIKTKLFTTASADKQGYWKTPLIAVQPGVHCVVQQLDRVMLHGRSIRSIRTAKAYFLVADKLDSPVLPRATHADPLGMPFELVLRNCPFSETVVGQPLRVQVLHQGKPISNVVVSFIPEGAELTGEFDPEYEFRSDHDGQVSFVPKAANLYLVVAHYMAEDEKSDEYETTSYASTITLHVPNQLPLASR